MLISVRPLLAVLFSVLWMVLGWLSTGTLAHAMPLDHTDTTRRYTACSETLTLSLSNTSPKLGQVTTITATLKNTGGCSVGSVRYAVTLEQPEARPVLATWSPLETHHSLKVDPGETDEAPFDLEVVGTGVVTLTAQADYEVHVGYPDPAYWGTKATDPISITVPTTTTLKRVLHATGHSMGCSQLATYGGVFYGESGFTCVLAPGHSISLGIDEFTDASAAEEAFRGAFTDRLLSLYRCYPAASWATGGFVGPIVYTHHAWVADKWVVHAENQDDTPLYAVPKETSNAFYRKAVDFGLFVDCVPQAVHLPLITAPRP